MFRLLVALILPLRRLFEFTYGTLLQRTEILSSYIFLFYYVQMLPPMPPMQQPLQQPAVQQPNNQNEYQSYGYTHLTRKSMSPANGLTANGYVLHIL